MIYTAYKDDILKIEYEVDKDGRYWVHCNIYQWSHNMRHFILQKINETWAAKGRPKLHVAAPIENKLLGKFLARIGFTHYKTVWWVDNDGYDKFIDVWHTEETENDFNYKRRFKRRFK